jgi:hypothetical protein
MASRWVTVQAAPKRQVTALVVASCRVTVQVVASLVLTVQAAAGWARMQAAASLVLTVQAAGWARMQAAAYSPAGQHRDAAGQVPMRRPALPLGKPRLAPCCRSDTSCGAA